MNIKKIKIECKNSGKTLPVEAPLTSNRASVRASAPSQRNRRNLCFYRLAGLTGHKPKTAL